MILVTIGPLVSHGLVSRLALELLEDGAARTKPWLARLLVREALHFLEVPAEEELDRLARCYEEPLRNHYEDSLTQSARSGIPLDGPAWALLLGLVQQEIGWATALADGTWPEQGKALAELVRVASRSMSEGAPEKWFQRVIAALPRVSPEYVFGFRPVTLDKPKPAVPKWLVDAVMIVRTRAPGRSLQLPLSLEKDGSRKSLKAMLNTVKPTGEVPLSVTEMPNPNQAWRAMIAMAQFLADPGTSTLAGTLEQTADAYKELDDSIGLVNAPWPLESILRFASSEQELRDFAKRVRDGELGDFQDWIHAEERWLKKGVSEKDLLWLTETGTPYNSSIASCGVPHGAFHILDNDKLTQECLVRVFKLMPEGRHRACFGRVILYLNLNPMHAGQEPERFTHDVFKDLITCSGDEHFFMDFLLCSENPREFIVSCGDAIKNVLAGKYIYAMPFGPHDGSDRQRHQEMMRLLCELYNERSFSRRWLLGPIAVLAVSGFQMQMPLEASGSDFTDRERAASVTIRAIQGYFDACDADVLKTRAVRNELERMGVLTRGWQRTGVIQDSVVAEKFLHAVWSTLEADEDRLRGGTLAALNELLGRRRSDLLSLEVWEKMGLPRSLRDVGVTARERAASAQN